MDRLQIVIDTREQRPWAFPEDMAGCVRGTINAGDYALADDAGFAIERKSLDDFLGTISTGWERFERELDRMDEHGFPAKIIIVEGRFQALMFTEDEIGIVRPGHNHPRLRPAFVMHRIAELQLRHRAAVNFADNSTYASALALSIFRERRRMIIK